LIVGASLTDDNVLLHLKGHAGEVDTATLYRVYLGRAELGGAMRARKLMLSGPRVLQRAFGRWFAWSAFAPASRQADERRRAASRLADPETVRVEQSLRQPTAAPR
jgi:hypothetical protein